MIDRLSPWQRFWDRKHSIYANERHRLFHYRRIAQDIIAELPHGEAIVLDYGCGDALDADRISRFCGRLLLYESAPSVRQGLTARFQSNQRILVLTPADLGSLGASTLDLIVMNSVIQYMAPEELDRILANLRSLLRFDGRLIVGDVVSPDGSILGDAASLIRSAARGGFLVAALWSLLATLFSPYRRLRREVGLSMYTESEITARLARAGFDVERRPSNFGFHPGRATYVAMRAR